MGPELYISRPERIGNSSQISIKISHFFEGVEIFSTAGEKN
jgi:hypothetical protein